AKRHHQKEIFSLHAYPFLFLEPDLTINSHALHYQKKGTNSKIGAFKLLPSLKLRTSALSYASSSR
ncbi:hypothetical protein KAT92_01910, partial [Candidatus Babeliales bacterium]|nr:hypothetical protein [Candidatus Babeliales bacterium]